MEWKLNEVDDRECTIDGSNVYTVISRVETPEKHELMDTTKITVRVDVMRSDDNEPLQSFVGEANAVRKAVIDWLDKMCPVMGGGCISSEHASYIGYEIMRARSDNNYVQA